MTHEIHMIISVSKVLLEHVTLIWYVFSVSASSVRGQGSVTAAETWRTKLERFTIWSLTEKVCCP